MKRRSILAAALILSLLTGCAGGSFSVPVTPVDPDPAPNQSPAVSGQEPPALEQVTANGLVLRLLELESSAHPEENVILSPLSIEMALGMAANGSAGTAREDLERLLGMDADRLNTLLEGYMELDHRGDSALSLANSVWFNGKLEGLVNDSFRHTMAGGYRAQEGFFTPFSEADAGTINGWVKEKTHGKIDSILTPRDLKEETLAVLINALYFNGKWTDPFEDYQVIDGKFKAPCADQDASLMCDTVGTYFQSEGFTGFSRSYEEGYEFIGILPDAEGPADLSKLDLDAFLSSESYAYDVDIQIPKFELEYAASLADTLTGLGLGSLFEDGSMDGLLTDSAREQGWTAWVSDVIHKTYMKMYEEGTEAAAVTAVMVKCGATAVHEPPQRKQVYLDRPFAFLIRDAYGQVVFCGTINSVK